MAIGHANTNEGCWLGVGIFPRDIPYMRLPDGTPRNLSLYAISQELTVAPMPVPGAALLGLIGMATSSLALRKRRKKAIPEASVL